MNIRAAIAIVVISAAACIRTSAIGGGLPTPQGSAFTYQGMLKQGGAPANGTYHLRFQLWDALTTGGVQVGADVDDEAIVVADGLFNTEPLQGAE